MFIRFFSLDNLDASIRASAQSTSGGTDCSGGSGGLIRLKAQQVFCLKSHYEKTVVQVTDIRWITALENTILRKFFMRLSSY